MHLYVMFLTSGFGHLSQTQNWFMELEGNDIVL